MAISSFSPNPFDSIQFHLVIKVLFHDLFMRFQVLLCHFFNNYAYFCRQTNERSMS